MTWEWIYIVSGILILPVFIYAIVASVRVNYVFDKYQKLNSAFGITARELAQKIAAENGLNITIETAGHFLGDHYDPKRKVVALTDEVINSTSITALAVAAHECGHAVQDQESYAPLKIRQFVIGLSSFTSRFLMPLIIISVFASIFMLTDTGYEFMKWVMISLCVIYGLSALASFVTLPTEFDASARAKKILDQMNIITDETESRGVSKVLNAAAQTYVAALAISLVYFLRMLSYVVLVFGRRD
jgi:Zn-dependent membrane protease YugP